MPLNHFVTSAQAVELIAAANTGALLAFDETYHFDDTLVQAWCDANNRGTEVLIASPGQSHIEALEDRGHPATRLSMLCRNCATREASQFFLYLEENRTESVCDPCHAQMQSDAEGKILSLLRKSAPRPGENWLSQPVDLPTCRTWPVVRNDSPQRLQHLIDICAAEGLPTPHATYLDFGCRTGFFCSGMASIGFNATGIDWAPNNVEVARLLSTYRRRDFAKYLPLDIKAFLDQKRPVTFDVTTVYEFSGWPQGWHACQPGIECLRKLFRQTNRIFVLERAQHNPETCSPSGSPPLDHSQLLKLMQTEGEFRRIEQIDGKQYNLPHDLLVGHKHSSS